jgi:hypothetical protein
VRAGCHSNTRRVCVPGTHAEIKSSLKKTVAHHTLLPTFSHLKPFGTGAFCCGPISLSLHSGPWVVCGSTKQWASCLQRFLFAADCCFWPNPPAGRSAQQKLFFAHQTPRSSFDPTSLARFQVGCQSRKAASTSANSPLHMQRRLSAKRPSLVFNQHDFSRHWLSRDTSRKVNRCGI